MATFEQLVRSLTSDNNNRIKYPEIKYPEIIMTVLWLDDQRDPFKSPHNSMLYALRTDDFTELLVDGPTYWVKNYQEFVKHLEEHGLPDLISFDHDLAEEHHYPHMPLYEGYQYDLLYPTFKEKTGLDCAKYLVTYCTTHGKKLPEYNVHSQNPRGRYNIEILLNKFNNVR